MQKVAVTGSTGHIGNNLVRMLVDHGFEVVAIYRSDSKLAALNDLTVEKVKGDVLDLSFLNNVFSKAEAVFHLAGVISIDGDPDGRVMKVNVEGTRNVVTACLQNNIKKLIHFSSNHALKYDKYTSIVNEETPLADASCTKYDYSKSLGELEVLKGVKMGLNASILNPSSIIGPHDYWNSLQGKMLQDLFEGKMPALVKGGFDWMDVRDAAKAAILALEKGKSGHRYLIGGRWASAKELAEICSQFSGKKAPFFVLPIWVAMLGLPFVKLQSWLSCQSPIYTFEALKILKNSNQNFSFKKAKTELGYSARSLEETVKDCFEWHKTWMTSDE